MLALAADHSPSNALPAAGVRQYGTVPAGPLKVKAFYFRVGHISL
jgi:hypothetical protein